MLTLRTYLRTNRANSLGECAIYFIVKDEWISSTLKVHPDYWDAANGIITKKHPKYYTINPTFQLIKSRAEQCISNYQTSERLFSRKHFEEFVFAGQEDADKPCFLKLIDRYCETMDLCWGRIKQDKVLRNDVKSINPNLRISDINYQFGLKFIAFLRTKKDSINNQNTIYNKMRQLKAFCPLCPKT